MSIGGDALEYITPTESGIVAWDTNKQDIRIFVEKDPKQLTVSQYKDVLKSIMMQIEGKKHG